MVPLLYDNEENIGGNTYNDTPFYFQKNLQGDIIAVTDGSGKVVARYRYDAWGVCVIQSDTSDCGIAGINPYRYRGYYYDVEIGMYYLQSRYYNPSVGRFVNGDDTTRVGLSCSNLYVYCQNEPIMGYEYSGNIGWATICAVIGHIFEFFVKIAQTAATMSNDMGKIINSIKKAKANGASKEWINLLKAKKKNLVNAKSLGVGEIANIAKALIIISTLVPYVSYIKRIKNGIIVFAELVVDIMFDVLSYVAGKLTELVCKLIPYAGYLLGWACSYVVGLLISEIFNNRRMKKIKSVFTNRVKNSSDYKYWVRSLGYSVKVSF